MSPKCGRVPGVKFGSQSTLRTLWSDPKVRLTPKSGATWLGSVMAFFKTVTGHKNI
jgi:hypothetical protein